MKKNYLVFMVLILSVYSVRGQNKYEDCFCKWINNLETINNYERGFIDKEWVVRASKDQNPNNKIWHNRYSELSRRITHLKVSIVAEIDSLSSILGDSVQCEFYNYDYALPPTSDSIIIHNWVDVNNYFKNELNTHEPIQVQKQINEMLYPEPDKQIINSLTIREKVEFYKTRLINIEFAYNKALRFIYTQTY